MMKVPEHNSKAWDSLAEKKDMWTIPVDEATIAEARKGNWEIVLTPIKPTPRDWFPDDLRGKNVLCLASGGGQQGPVLAAAGANVTVFDNSPKQLAQDRLVAEREGLDMDIVQGDMKDLSCFVDNSFDLVFHPVANVFAENILPVWKETARVMKPGASLLAGFFNPVPFIFDLGDFEQGKFTVRHSLPYADTRDMSEEELKKFVFDRDYPVCFGHTLTDQIQGQIEAGLVITGFFEDKMGRDDPLDKYLDAFIATRSVKMTSLP